jgi:hypothetical protein
MDSCMPYSSSGDLRSRLAALMRAWFSPARWTTADMFVALAGLVLAVAVFLPWFKATVSFSGSDITGTLMDPPGTLSGFSAHRYLIAVLAVALLETVVIVARHYPGRWVPRLPFHRYFLVIASGVVFVLVVAGALLRPAAWYGQLQMPDNFHVTTDWTYGALVAVGAAVISLGIAVAALRSDGI